MPDPHHIRHRVQEALAHRPVSRLAHRHLRSAAVLLPLVERDDGPHVLFTVRTDTVEHHKGQISFPGGGIDGDGETLLATALRETSEEIGVDPQHVEILGRLDDTATPSGFCISSFVGWLSPDAAPAIKSAVEIREIFTAPLATLLDPAAFREDPPVSIDIYTFTIPHFQFGPHDIWGATGRILRQFFEEAFEWRPPAG
ncbi:MAG: CoA pyrophosphatase [Nitrospirae bacterium]|nr:CoA pyrophosphatase [Nitrospirota bacterium]